MITPLQQPINYLGLVPQVDVGQKFLEGLRVGQGFQQLDIQNRQLDLQQQQEERLQQAATAKIAEQEKYKAMASEAFASNDPAVKMRFFAQYPEVAEKLTKAMQFHSDQENDSVFANAISVTNAIRSGKRDVALNQIIQYRDAAANTNQNVAPYNRLIELAQNGDWDSIDNAAQTMAAGARPDSYAKWAKQILESEAQPSEIALKQAQARQALDEAKRRGIGRELADWYMINNIAFDQPLTPKQKQEAFAYVEKVKRAGAANVSVNAATDKGVSSIVQGAIEELPKLGEAVDGSERSFREASLRMEQVPQMMLGLGVNERLTINSGLAAITGTEVDDSSAIRREFETYRKGLALEAAKLWMKGQGAITDFERKMLSEFATGKSEFTAKEWADLLSGIQKYHYWNMQQSYRKANNALGLVEKSKVSEAEREFARNEFGRLRRTLPDINTVTRKDPATGKLVTSYRIAGTTDNFATFGDAANYALSGEQSSADMPATTGGTAAPVSTGLPPGQRPPLIPAREGNAPVNPKPRTSIAPVVGATGAVTHIPAAAARLPSGQVYARPSAMTDQQWADYLKATGAKEVKAK